MSTQEHRRPIWLVRPLDLRDFLDGSECGLPEDACVVVFPNATTVEELAAAAAIIASSDAVMSEVTVPAVGDDPETEEEIPRTLGSGT